MSDIHSLTARVQELSVSANRWDKAVIAVLAFAAIAAALTFWCGYVANRRHLLLDRAREELSAAKDRQLQADLAQKELEIETAKQGAANASERSSKAELGVAEANKHVADANRRAAEAQKTAAGFERDIALANEEAAKAQAQVAQAMAEAARANLELERIKAPRTLSNVASLTESLKAYKGTEYTFSSVFGDEESILLLRQIDAALTNSGWIRVKPPRSYPEINVYGQDQDFAVAPALTSGVSISVDSDIPPATLEGVAVDRLPAPTGAAVALAMALTGSLTPPQAVRIKVNVVAGNSPTVRIDVGKKP